MPLVLESRVSAHNGGLGVVILGVNLRELCNRAVALNVILSWPQFLYHLINTEL